MPGLSLGRTKTVRAGRRGAPTRSRASFGFLWNRNAIVDGLSMGLGASVVDQRMDGVQLSFVAAVAPGAVAGWQGGMTFDHAGTLLGAQTGFVNYAARVEKGTQLGLIDVAKTVHGAQVGLVTWADEADAAIGLLTLTRKGNVHPEVYTSDVAGINLALRFPTRYTYSMVTMGVHPGGKHQSWLVGLGFGGHIPLKGPFFLDIDLVGQVVLQPLKVTRKPGTLGQLRIMFDWQARDRLSLFAGPTVSVLAHQDDPTAAADDRLARPGYPWVVGDLRRGSIRIRIWPGFVAGIRF